ncbi:DUF3278 domain-containing protein [Pseudobacillus badius]|uniref:DUF3278 domain-containing protein n=1 Tax=Bacillus badius TaxID=1455 RepID=UPI001CC02435|nr:DUF3278 domain-containing protein [Bacillus badius]UAT28993.1 DUF3278 domain-containing protein [Bacillus badius]GLY12594.1 hypothetical protein Bbad01_38100 [Bacillus badius]
MKSWISFLLPNDEYKEKKMLYFFSEGAIILFLSLIVMIVCNKYFNLDVETALLAALAIFLFYVSGRYIVSGIEYTDISTERAYRKELRVIFIRTIRFVVIFMALYLIFINVPTRLDKWFEILGLLISISVVWFLSSYISLKRSYKKNKELL